ncbi:MAG TPA: 5-(carboxyamino)imidazole ribonucleotide synthase [Gemmatimonadaceae bacterium]|nr:5-(carboxyamino)imidazole ribonucleotide synthase [Gemmatimonadaceae bacterium]
MSSILPGATIGLLGGGQLGRMTGYAARSLGFELHVLDPDPDCPARAVASRVITARFDDADAAADLASRCDIVTLEIEQIAPAALAAVEARAPLRPGANVVTVVQNRLHQREWLDRHGFPVGPWRGVDSAEACVAAFETLGPTVFKAPVGGYDGRGQVRATTRDQARDAWSALGGRPLLAEQFLKIDLELSVLVARRPDGSAAIYPPAINHHERGVLDWSVFPGTLPPAVVREAMELGESLARSLGVVGLLAAELFLVDGRRLLVNELAPRPHNSYHHSERACSTSQFEQFVRAVCDLPLGSVTVVRPAAIANLLGDLWRGGSPPPWPDALAIPDVRLHLYGKTAARPGRKMGHLSAIGETVDLARAKVLSARSTLSRT